MADKSPSIDDQIQFHKDGLAEILDMFRRELPEHMKQHMPDMLEDVSALYLASIQG